jgi:uncharacterized MAPEG superfamily protein
MTIAHYCLALAVFSPYVFTFIAKFTGDQKIRYHDNRDPREWLAKQMGYRKRANNAQQNSFEALPGFAAAVLVAQQVGTAPQSTIDLLAMAFVATRVVYGVSYLADWALTRSIVWSAGLACVAALFAVSI